MLKKIFLDIFFILVIILLLFTKYVNIELFNAKPDLLLIFVVFIGILEGTLHPVIFGFIGGLSVDFISNSLPLGFNAFIYTIIGYLTIIPYKLLKIESSFIAAIALLIYYLIKNFFFLLLGFLFLPGEYIVSFYNNIFLSEMIYTFIVGLFLFIFFKNIYNFIDSVKKYV